MDAAPCRREAEVHAGGRAGPAALPEGAAGVPANRGLQKLRPAAATAARPAAAALAAAAAASDASCPPATVTAAAGSTRISQPSPTSAVHSTNSDVQPTVAYCTAHATAWATTTPTAAAAAATTATAAW